MANRSLVPPSEEVLHYSETESELFRQDLEAQGRAFFEEYRITKSSEAFNGLLGTVALMGTRNGRLERIGELEELFQIRTNT
jgi:hypothetical protein